MHDVHVLPWLRGLSKLLYCTRMRCHWLFVYMIPLSYEIVFYFRYFQFRFSFRFSFSCKGVLKFGKIKKNHQKSKKYVFVTFCYEIEYSVFCIYRFWRRLYLLFSLISIVWYQNYLGSYYFFQQHGFRPKVINHVVQCLTKRHCNG